MTVKGLQGEGVAFENLVKRRFFIKRIVCVVVASVWMLCVVVSFSQAQTPVVIGSDVGSVVVEISELVLKEAYQRAGIPMEIKHHPSKRSLIMANDGEVDGQVNRIRGIEKAYPNLVMVPVVVQTHIWYAFVKQGRDISITAWDWESLRPYRIARHRGIRLAEKRTGGMKTHVVDTWEQIVKLIDIERDDIGLFPIAVGLSEIQRMNITTVVPSVPLEKVQVYHYLHKSRQDLVPRLTRVLQQMEREGRIQAIRDEYITTRFGDLLPKAFRQ